MDRLTGGTALAAALFSLALTACGGGSSSAAAAAPGTAASSPTVTIQGVSTPDSISVVTAKGQPQP